VRFQVVRFTTGGDGAGDGWFGCSGRSEPPEQAARASVTTSGQVNVLTVESLSWR
jgi:hypothetical protein